MHLLQYDGHPYKPETFNFGCTTQDKPDAKDIVTSKCSIEFRDVSFSYVADSPVIKDVSFTCPGGQTLALVGATGRSSAVSRACKLGCMLRL